MDETPKDDASAGVVYSDLAGKDLGRIAALSDGIFGVAMTLLILDVHTPSSADVTSEGTLLLAIGALAPKFLTWILSAMTLGIFWVGQQTQLDNLRRSDRNLTWLFFLFLAAVSALPFSTRLLSEFIDYRVALAAYWVNIFACGAALYLCRRYAERAQLVRAENAAALSAAIRRRIVFAQALYLAAALIGMSKPIVGVTLIIAIQLTYVFQLPLPRRLRH
jgi:uncharacterized membrane protein